MLRSTVLAAACASAFALSACNSACSFRSGCAYQRNDPTKAQKSGVHGDSIKRRLGLLERRAGKRIRGLVVNEWGEIWTELEGGRYVAISHDGSDVRQNDTVNEIVPTDDAFPVHDVDPYAIDRAMKRIAAVNPGHGFVRASLTRDDFLYGGLRWEVMVGGGTYFATYDVAPDGSSVCRTVVSDHGKASPVHRCPDFGHQPPGIPASH